MSIPIQSMKTTIQRRSSSGFQQIEISTVFTVDCGWETAYFYCNRHRSEVIEHYDNENEAILGHLKHVKDQLTK